MAKTTSPTAASSPVSAGVKTPGRGVFSNPTQVGAMIQSMYPQYRNMDATTLGQRWIDVHTPTSGGGTGGGTTDILSGPVGTTQLTNTNPNSPDLSGLGQFATPIQPKTPAKSTTPLNITSGLQALGNGISSGSTMMGQNPNTLYSTPVQYAPKPKPQSLPLSTFDISKVQF